jgi:hypothetical protein
MARADNEMSDTSLLRIDAVSLVSGSLVGGNRATSGAGKC